jgi:uncharacterized membrane protein
MKHRLDWLEAALLTLPFIVIAWFWERLPAQIPMHWNLAGEVDRWSSSRWEVLILPVLGLVTVLLIRFLPRIDPKLTAASETGRMPVALQAIRLALASCLVLVFAVQIAQALDAPVSGTRLVVLCVLLLFAIMGNYLGNLRQNYFVGIRTPWTLEDPNTWRATHRIGGQLLFFGSSLLIILGFIVSEPLLVSLAVTSLLAFVLWAFAYSWHDFRQRRPQQTLS